MNKEASADPERRRRNIKYAERSCALLCLCSMLYCAISFAVSLAKAVGCRRRIMELDLEALDGASASEYLSLIEGASLVDAFTLLLCALASLFLGLFLVRSQWLGGLFGDRLASWLPAAGFFTAAVCPALSAGDGGFASALKLIAAALLALCAAALLPLDLSLGGRLNFAFASKVELGKDTSFRALCAAGLCSAVFALACAASFSYSGIWLFLAVMLGCTALTASAWLFYYERYSA